MRYWQVITLTLPLLVGCPTDDPDDGDTATSGDATTYCGLATLDPGLGPVSVQTQDGLCFTLRVTTLAGGATPAPDATDILRVEYRAAFSNGTECYFEAFDLDGYTNGLRAFIAAQGPSRCRLPPDGRTQRFARTLRDGGELVYDAAADRWDLTVPISFETYDARDDEPYWGAPFQSPGSYRHSGEPGDGAASIPSPAIATGCADDGCYAADDWRATILVGADSPSCQRALDDFTVSELRYTVQEGGATAEWGAGWFRPFMQLGDSCRFATIMDANWMTLLDHDADQAVFVYDGVPVYAGMPSVRCWIEFKSDLEPDGCRPPPDPKLPDPPATDCPQRRVLPAASAVAADGAVISAGETSERVGAGGDVVAWLQHPDGDRSSLPGLDLVARVYDPTTGQLGEAVELDVGDRRVDKVAVAGAASGAAVVAFVQGGPVWSEGCDVPADDPGRTQTVWASVYVPGTGFTDAAWLDGLPTERVGHIHADFTDGDSGPVAVVAFVTSDDLYVTTWQDGAWADAVKAVGVDDTDAIVELLASGVNAAGEVAFMYVRIYPPLDDAIGTLPPPTYYVGHVDAIGGVTLHAPLTGADTKIKHAGIINVAGDRLMLVTSEGRQPAHINDETVGEDAPLYAQFVDASGVTERQKIGAIDGVAWADDVAMPPHVLRDGDGALVVFAFRPASGGNKVHYSAAFDGSAWSAPAGPIPQGFESIRASSAAVSAGKAILVGGFRHSGNRENVYSRFDGAAWSTPAPVDGGKGEGTAVTLADDGAALVLYETESETTPGTTVVRSVTLSP